MTMPDLAQTNLQLLREVLAAEWSDADLQRLRAAYELTMWAFTGQYRAHGKTQIAHHVGVASALQRTGARPALVIAGVAHSLYFLGEFGTGRVGPHEEKRARVRRDLGTEIERIIYEYTELPWSRASVAQLPAEAATASAPRRDAVVLRVANEVDEHADAENRWSATDPNFDLVGPDVVDLVVVVAEAYGVPDLGVLLREADAAGAALLVAGVLVSPQENTVFVPPASYRRRAHVAAQDSGLGHELAARVPGARRAAAWVRAKLA